MDHVADTPCERIDELHMTMALRARALALPLFVSVRREGGDGHVLRLEAEGDDDPHVGMEDDEGEADFRDLLGAQHCGDLRGERGRDGCRQPQERVRQGERSPFALIETPGPVSLGDRIDFRIGEYVLPRNCEPDLSSVSARRRPGDPQADNLHRRSIDDTRFPDQFVGVEPGLEGSGGMDQRLEDVGGIAMYRRGDPWRGAHELALGE